MRVGGVWTLILSCIAVFAVETSLADVPHPPVFRPLSPPSQRLEQGDVIHPPTSRFAPVKSDAIPPPPYLDISNSPFPSPQPVDLKTITVGNCIEHRTYLDYPERMVLVFPGLQFPSDGTIHQWDVYTGRDCNLEAQIFRPTSVPRALDENEFAVNNYFLVGSNILAVPALGNYSFVVSEESRIHVKAGDVIGFFTEQPGCVSWSDGGSQTLFRYNKAGHNEMSMFNGTVFIGDGVHRTYSISATGTFSIPDHAYIRRLSPSSSVSVTPRPDSKSPSSSPSGSISTSPVYSTSASRSAEPSPSISSSISFSPSITPTIFSKESQCSLGVSFWCANADNMKLCNISQPECDAIISALHPVILPSATPTQTASVSLSPSLLLSPVRRPSVTPSASLALPPYLQESDGQAGLTNCNYCNGGTDWTGGKCLTGQNQSPIAINFPEVTTDSSMNLYFSIRYNYVHAEVFWNDYAFAIAPKFTNGSNATITTFGSINIDTINYDADLAFIRAPSEHQLQGSITPMELQIYHHKRGSNPPVTVAVSVLFEESLDDQENLMWLYDIPADKSAFHIAVDLEEYLSDLRPLVFYNGSFTQPPCSENVLWAVSMKPAKIGYNQLQALNKFLKNNRAFANGRGNNRVLQSINGRQLLLRSNCGMTGSNMECGEGGKVSGSIVPEDQGGAADDGLFEEDGVKLW